MTTENVPQVPAGDAPEPETNSIYTSGDAPAAETATKKTRGPKAIPSDPGHVVGKGKTDSVLVSQAVYKNPHTRKSLTVHHLQRRLRDIGHEEAYADRDGFYGDLTRASVTAWQKENGAEVGPLDFEQLVRIFHGDPNVTVEDR
jgi:hypothetical protein